MVTLKVYGEGGRALPTSNLQSITSVIAITSGVLTHNGPYVVEPTMSVTVNVWFVGALVVAFTCTSKTMCPATIVVFAFTAVRPNWTGLVQLAPADEPAVDEAEKPLSVAIMPLGNFTIDPNSA
jgi:hypothetical protein